MGTLSKYVRTTDKRLIVKGSFLHVIKMAYCRDRQERCSITKLWANFGA